MNIYIDGMFFRSSGIGRCYENLLRALDEADDVYRICTLVPKSREADFRRSFSSRKIDARFADFSYLGAADFLRKGSLIRAFRPAPDIFYFPNINVPFFWEGKAITQVHDLIPLSRHSDWPWRHRFAFRVLARRALRRSCRAVCVSEFTKGQVMSEFDIPGDRILVIPNWIDDWFLRGSPMTDRRKPFVEGDYLLYIGNRSPHKNLKTMIEAFRSLSPDFPDLKVVVAGARMRGRDAVDDAESDPAVAGKIVQLPQVPDDMLRNLYAFARVFVFPTFMEGFGIPPLEALSFGVPAVCSDIPAVREICGDAVRYADPFDPGAFAREIRSALTDPQANAEFRGRGVERLSLYRRESALARYMDLFRGCLEGDMGKAGAGRRR
ncbi:MAG: glycosyltransferase family 4 protein [Deltaproteobacteria bacterium]|nr:glycosyltransferase family 4 protein [Deltaproteobacteria bacterium]